MHANNVHERNINEKVDKVWPLLEFLGSKNDRAWPGDQWPPMRLDHGLKVGSKGGHGPIKYTVTSLIPMSLLIFSFTSPKGFDGFHRLDIVPTSNGMTLLKHTIKMKTTGWSTLQWLVYIRWLHDALIEDFFDRVENSFAGKSRSTLWNFWVRFLRQAFLLKFKFSTDKAT